LRLDVDWNDPQFGKPVRCDHPSHHPEEVARLSAMSGLDEADLGIRLTNIVVAPGNQAMVNACREFIAEPKGWLYIHGTFGNAKSVALMAIINELNERRLGPATYCNLSEIIDWVKESFSKKEQMDEKSLSYTQRFDKLKAIPVLAIDEMSAISETEWVLEFQHKFLDHRYRQAIRGETVTVFAGNEHPQALPGAIWDRVRDGRFQIVENTEPSSRPVMHWSDEL